MMQTQSCSLKQLFKDENYAWQLLQSQVKIETYDQVTSQDVSSLLQLYMKGVQKMNTFLDFREAFFKQRVMTLMSRPNVMKTLNKKKVMSKKNIMAQGSVQKQNKSDQVLSPNWQVSSGSVGSGKKLQNKSQLLQLKQKKRQISVRLAYGAQQNSPEIIQRLMSEQNHKQRKLTEKIKQIDQIHEQRLEKRIKERKLKTVTKSLSNVLVENVSNIFLSNKQITIAVKNKQKIQEAFGSCKHIEEVVKNRKFRQEIRKCYRSLQPQKGIKFCAQSQSPLRKALSYNIGLHRSSQNIQIFDDRVQTL